MLDTAMKFAGGQQSSESDPSSTLATLRNLARFLRPTHALIRELQRKFVAQVILALSHQTSSEEEERESDLRNGEDGQRKQLVAAAGQSKQSAQGERKREGNAQDDSKCQNAAWLSHI